MTTPSLPTDPEVLEELLEQASILAWESRSVLSLLREVEARPGAYPPATLVHLPETGRVALSWVGATLLWQVNHEVRGAAARALQLLPRLDLNAGEAAHVRELAASDQEDGEPRGQAPGLSLVGLLRTGAEPVPEEVQDADRLRLGVLVRVMEKVHDAAEALRRRLDLVIHPPSVQDRMKVDQSNGLVILDGKEYLVREGEAVLFKYLVEANGEPVSGVEIARREKVKEVTVHSAVRSEGVGRPLR